MPDEKSNFGNPRVGLVVVDQEDKVRYFAEKYGLNLEFVGQVRYMVARIANEWDKRNRIANEWDKRNKAEETHISNTLSGKHNPYPRIMKG